MRRVAPWVLGILVLTTAAAAAPRRPSGEGAAPISVRIPLPPPRPADLFPAEPPPPVEPAPAPPPPDAAAATDPCRARLAALGARFEALPPIRQGACGADDPLRVSHLTPDLELKPPATVVCPVAEALALWARDDAGPAARAHLGSALVAIRIGTSYECRGQNRRAGAKLSDHAFANAVDVMAFEIKGRDPIVVQAREGTPEARFQAAARAGACARFTTVLGPGSDAAHDNHLHLDLRARKGGTRLCQ